jgi:hypothetical protein
MVILITLMATWRGSNVGFHFVNIVYKTHSVSIYCQRKQAESSFSAIGTETEYRYLYKYSERQVYFFQDICLEYADKLSNSPPVPTDPPLYKQSNK